MTDRPTDTADAPLTADERAQLETWERYGVYACYHSSVICPTPVACREKFGLYAAVENILAARETALRETIAQEIEALHPARINSTSVHEKQAYKAGTKDAARIVRG
jgi:hypothetical protein